MSEQSGAGARLVLIGLAAVALVASAATWGRVPPSRPELAVAAAQEAPAGPVPTSTSSSSTTTTRVLPPAPPARPLVLPPGRSAPVLSRLPITEKVVFLGIDDGMVRDPAVLDHLERHHIPFAAFLTLGFAQEEPEFWRRAVAIGGTVQAHTVDHPDLTQVGGARLRAEVCGPIEPFQALTGQRPTLFRPPFGKLTEAVRRQAAECGYRAIILWKGSTNNGRLTMQEGALQPGDILLLHWRDTLRDDIDDVIARCRQEGFTIGRLEDHLP